MKNGWLSLWTLKLNGHIVAIEYQIQSDGKVQVLAVGDDPVYRMLLPWSALNLTLIQALFQSGSAYEYSVGPGVKNNHRWWANGNHEGVHLKLYRSSLYSHFLRQLDPSAIPGP